MESRCAAPFTRRVISRFIVSVSPLAPLVKSCYVNKHWLQKSDSHLVMSEHIGVERVLLLEKVKLHRPLMPTTCITLHIVGTMGNENAMKESNEYVAVR